MPAFNSEMLKQLLDSFVDQEQAVSDEMQAVEKQIQECVAKIEQCRGRIESMAQDRQKILAMKERYANGAGAEILSSVKPQSKEATKAPAPVKAGSGATADKSEVAPQSKPATDKPLPLDRLNARGEGTDSQAASGSKALDESPRLEQEVAQDPSRQPISEDKKESSDAAKVLPGQGEENNEENLKSLNDALKNLFR